LGHGLECPSPELPQPHLRNLVFQLFVLQLCFLTCRGLQAALVRHVPYSASWCWISVTQLIHNSTGGHLENLLASARATHLQLLSWVKVYEGFCFVLFFGLNENMKMLPDYSTLVVQSSLKPRAVAYTCNPSYLAGREQEGHSSRPAHTKKFSRTHLNH
jgi:hypothetical protein